MRYFFIAISLIALVGIIFLLLHPRTGLPAHMPTELFIEGSRNGGHGQEGASYALRTGESTAQIFRGTENGVTYKFVVTEEEMNDLYALLQAERFGTIATQNGEMERDAQETHVTVSWDTTVIHLYNGASTRIANSDNKRFFAVTNALERFVETKMSTATLVQ